MIVQRTATTSDSDGTPGKQTTQTRARRHEAQAKTSYGEVSAA